MSEGLSHLSNSALPLVDQEYDIPEYKYLVDHLIAEELQHSSIDDVDLNRRFPKLWSDAELDACVKRIEQRGLITQPKLDLSAHYAIVTPDVSEQKSPEAWQKSINHLRAQIVHQENEVINLELLHSKQQQISQEHLRFNTALEAIQGYYTAQEQAVARATMEGQKARQSVQQKASFPLLKYWQRKNNANISRFQVEAAYESLNASLLARGFDYAAEEAQKIEDNLPENKYFNNNTVKEYATVHETATVEDVVDDEDDNEGKNKEAGDTGRGNKRAGSSNVEAQAQSKRARKE